MSLKKPRILLIGVGKFGEKHLDTLLTLEKKGLLELAGVVVKTKKSESRLNKSHDFPVYTKISDGLLHGVDGVDIVTPPETHFEIVRQCLKSTNVLVEKPLAMTIKEAVILKKKARASKKVLMVGHIFRFHPSIKKLEEILKKTKEKPLLIEGVFINPKATDNGRDIELEFLHLFDMADYLFNKAVVSKFTQRKNGLKTVSLKYKGNFTGIFKLGWYGAEKVRSLKLVFKNQIIISDLIKNTITIHRNGSVIKKYHLKNSPTPLEAELVTFLKAIQKKKVIYPDATVGQKIIDIATKNKNESEKIKTRKKIAIIGAGIFGTNCAIELAKSHDVTIFEKNDGILLEASFINQYRHHWGYHYPRSQGTVDDIRLAIEDFENIYEKAIIRKFPTYYSIAKEGSKVSAQEYLDFCDKNKLPYTIEHPAHLEKNFIDQDKVKLCLKTFEPIYDYAILKKITNERLKKSGAKLKLNSEIIGAKITSSGQKTLAIKNITGVISQNFDYVINVTYARHNQFCKWLGFPVKPIRLDLVEALWVKLNIPKMSLAVMDGPFSNMVPTGKDNIFTLVHIKESILRRFVPRDGLVPRDILKNIKKTNINNIMKRSIEWFPIIKEAKFLRSYYVLRGVNAYREHDDARTSDIAEHGFGCLSILGGKIVNSVTTAKEVARLIS